MVQGKRIKILKIGAILTGWCVFSTVLAGLDEKKMGYQQFSMCFVGKYLCLSK